jgi:Bacterial inner membrane protein
MSYNNPMLLAQAIGFIGVGLLVLAFQFNHRQTILRLQLISGLVWATHFFLLGAATGAAMNLLMAGRNYAFDRFRHQRGIFWCLLLVIVGVGLLTWSNWTSSLPLVAGIISTIAVWQKNPRAIRFLSLGVPPLWFAYNLLNGSYPGMAGDTITFCCLLIAIYRFDIRRKPIAHRAVRVEA